MANGVTRNVDTWDVFNHHVERNLDHSAYSAAHPDDVLVLAGPARRSSIVPSATNGVGSLFSLGQIQMGQVSSSLPIQPTKALGSTRKFFLMDSAMNQIQLARLVMNSRNLLRALYHSAVEAGIDVGDPSVIGTEASYNGRSNQQWWINLDSPIYRVPIGLGFILRDRGGSHIGGMWCEICHIQQWSVQFASGQSAVVENCGLVCDRILPFGDSSVVGQLAALFDVALNQAGLTADAKARAGATDNIS